MKTPSYKQIEFAESLARDWHVDLPKDFTAQAYWKSINQYAPARPRYEPDEDELYWNCVNDVWCEEY